MANETGFWDVVSSLGQGAAGIVIGAAGVAFIQKYTRNGNGKKNGNGCVLLNADSSKLRAIEISDEVSDRLMPHQERQTELLQEIRDGIIKLTLKKGD